MRFQGIIMKLHQVGFDDFYQADKQVSPYEYCG